MRLTNGERAIFLQVLNVKIQQGSVFMLGDGTTTDDVERILETIEDGRPLMEVSRLTFK